MGDDGGMEQGVDDMDGQNVGWNGSKEMIEIREVGSLGKFNLPFLKNSSIMIFRNCPHFC